MVTQVHNLVDGSNARNQIDWIVKESRKGTHSIGFLPRCTLERYAQRGWITIAIDQGQNVGFLISGRHKNEWAIYQLWTVMDARRIGIGQALTQDLEFTACKCNIETIRARVATDLESNIFWSVMGYKETAIIPGGRWRSRLISLRIKSVSQPIAGQFSGGIVQQSDSQTDPISDRLTVILNHAAGRKLSLSLGHLLDSSTLSDQAQ